MTNNPTMEPPPLPTIACERCRSVKRTCDFESEVCSRCAKAGHTCIRREAKKRGPKGPWKLKDAKPVKGRSRRVKKESPEPRSLESATSIASPSSISGSLSLRDGFGVDEGSPDIRSASSTSLALVGTGFERNLAPWSPAETSQQFAMHNYYQFGPAVGLAEQFFEDYASMTPSHPPPARPLALFPVLPTADSLFTNHFYEAVVLYFNAMEVPYPMLHQGRFLSSATHSSLLVGSMFLVLPKALKVANSPIPQHFAAAERGLSMRVAAEASALLASGQRTTVEDIAALVNIRMWLILSGLAKQAGQLFSVIEALMFRDSHFAPRLTWEQLALQTLSSPMAADLPDEAKRSLLRALWIDYFVGARVANTVMALKFLMASWNRGQASPAPVNIAALVWPSHPMPKYWLASQDPTFDPRTVPSEPLIGPSLSCFLLDTRDPRRRPAIAGLAANLVRVRMLLPWTYVYLRNRIDRFLSACEQAGFASPGHLPRHISGDSGMGAWPPQVVALINERDLLDVDLSDLTAFLPDAINRALRDGSASELYDAYFAYSGAPVHSFNSITIFLLLISLRMELHTSLGVYPEMIPTASGGGEATALDVQRASDNLADEFAACAGDFPEFLRMVISCTRILEELSRLNQAFIRHTIYLLTFRLAFLHGALLRRVKEADAGAVASGIIASIEHDVSICLRLLERYAHGQPVGASMLNLARKLLAGHGFAKGEVAASNYVEDVAAGGHGEIEYEHGEEGDHAGRAGRFADLLQAYAYSSAGEEVGSI